MGTLNRITDSESHFPLFGGPRFLVVVLVGISGVFGGNFVPPALPDTRCSSPLATHRSG